jgi:hypothetical protein
MASPMRESVPEFAIARGETRPKAEADWLTTPPTPKKTRAQLGFLLVEAAGLEP